MEHASFWLIFALSVCAIVGFYVSSKLDKMWILIVAFCVALPTLLLGLLRYAWVEDTIQSDMMTEQISCLFAGGELPSHASVSRSVHAFVYMRFNAYGVEQHEKGIHVLTCPDGTQVRWTQY